MIAFLACCCDLPASISIGFSFSDVDVGYSDQFGNHYYSFGGVNYVVDYDDSSQSLGHSFFHGYTDLSLGTMEFHSLNIVALAQALYPDYEVSYNPDTNHVRNNVYLTFGHFSYQFMDSHTGLYDWIGSGSLYMRKRIF